MKSLKGFTSFIVPIFGLLFIVGCASGPTDGRAAVPKTIPATIENWNDGMIDYAEFKERFRLEDYKLVQFMPIDSSRIDQADPNDASHDAVVHACKTGASLLAGGAFSQLKGVVPCKSGPLTTDTGRTLLVTSRINVLESGSHAVRVIFPFGGGGVYAEVEGDIIDKDRGVTLIHYRTTNYSSTVDPVSGAESLFNETFDETGQELGVLLMAFRSR